MKQPLKDLLFVPDCTGVAEKIMNLERMFENGSRYALAFSGGVDSSFLLYAGLEFGADIRPYYIKTAFQPDFELKNAAEISEALGIKITVIYEDVISAPHIAKNTHDRCYYCKRLMLSLIKEKASSDGCEIVMDGTNASDDAGDRPGMRALRENSVVSPLRESGITKKEIRLMLKEAGFAFWDKPAYSCLATRICTGENITLELLSRVEKAENELFMLGFSDFRVRICQNSAKLQFDESEIERAVLSKKEIVRRLEPYFDSVRPDFEVRGIHE